MKHVAKGRKFGRRRAQRSSFVKGLMANVILRGRIKTTEARAKEIRPKVEKLVTIGRKQNLAAMRLLLSRLPKDAAMKLYHDVAPKYTEVKGGYMRITKTAHKRMRDGAEQVVLEFTK